ncbi:GNAT family N-acetyltransferase [Hyphobacterium sp. SN044]|uniref:GNAT family N-acetyltransferase n=1 Tax=Hyphobacterium sp. SN044 TaxID=2912575 RepID=UPI001F1EFC03|nr:GNAT family N-acetyltransferase [Hyphobacterium sp. SN044]MCF8878827.1 GNAT family N-acetyltransferase [Hyphobacterium sp. SN044]
MTEPVSIKAEDPRTADGARLIGALDAHLSALYDPQFNYFLDLDQLAQPNITFLVARNTADEALGCVALREYADFAEIKRMYVDEAARGLGIAKALLKAAHDLALSKGFETVRLETGDRQTAAIGLYEQAGYRPCGCYGDYAPDSPHNHFFEIRLSPAATV